jgi:hypothetical protein
MLKKYACWQNLLENVKKKKPDNPTLYSPSSITPYSLMTLLFAPLSNKYPGAVFVMAFESFLILIIYAKSRPIASL